MNRSSLNRSRGAFAGGAAFFALGAPSGALAAPAAATPGDATIVLVDAWIWNNTMFTRFNIPQPADLASYADAPKARRPQTAIVALAHDHGRHIGARNPLVLGPRAGDDFKRPSRARAATR